MCVQRFDEGRGKARERHFCLVELASGEVVSVANVWVEVSRANARSAPKKHWCSVEHVHRVEGGHVRIRGRIHAVAVLQVRDDGTCRTAEVHPLLKVVANGEKRPSRAVFDDWSQEWNHEIQNV
jgi:hypothetical protein